MKQLLTVLLLVPFFGISQNVFVEKDQFTGAEKKETTMEEVSSGLRLKGMTYGQVKTLVFFIELGRVGSISKDAKIMLKMANDSVYTYLNESNFNADKYLYSTIILTDKEMALFKTNQLKAVRIYMNDGYQDYTVKDTKLDAIQRIIKLL